MPHFLTIAIAEQLQLILIIKSGTGSICQYYYHVIDIGIWHLLDRNYIVVLLQNTMILAGIWCSYMKLTYVESVFDQL